MPKKGSDPDLNIQPKAETGPRPVIRLDKYLWQARFFKTRSLSAKLISSGKVRVNGVHASKPARSVGPGDVLTFPQAKNIRVIKILAIGERRGPAPEAQALYEDLTPKAEPSENSKPLNPKFEGKGRPTGRDRRNARSQLRDIDASGLAGARRLD